MRPSPNAQLFRHQTRHRPDQAQRQRRVVIATTPSEVWVRSTSKTQQIHKLFATDLQLYERKNLHELGAERAILQRQTLRRFKRVLCPRPTSRTAHNRYTKCMLSAPRAKIAKILREIQALPAQILRECDAKRTTFST